MKNWLRITCLLATFGGFQRSKKGAKMGDPWVTLLAVFRGFREKRAQTGDFAGAFSGTGDSRPCRESAQKGVKKCPFLTPLGPAFGGSRRIPRSL